MTDLAPIRTEYGGEDRRWLRDTHGLTDTLGGTLDGDLFPAGTFADGTVKSGTVLGRVTASGLVGPYAPAETDGRQTAIGLLVDSTKVAAGRRQSVAILDHGAVLRNYLPDNSGLDAAAEADLPRVRFTTG